jgi:hypothetical protein
MKNPSITSQFALTLRPCGNNILFSSHLQTAFRIEAYIYWSFPTLSYFFL